MLSAVIPSERSQPAVLLAEQLAHQRFVRPGPLVLGTALLKSPARAADRDRTVSRRSKPSSRTALMGEQPNPWERLHPQDATSRHRGAKPCRRCDANSPITRSADYTFTSFEVVAFYGSHRCGRKRAATSISRGRREVVTGSSSNEETSLGITPYLT